MTKIIILIELLFIVFTSAQPPVPKTWPANFFTWMVTTVTLGNNPTPVFDKGQLIVFNSGERQYSCRYDQQDLKNPNALRAVDFCDYNIGFHYELNDSQPTTPPNQTCSEMSRIIPILNPLVWPQEFIDTAQWLGVDPVNDRYCNHFFARPVPLNGRLYQIDAWFDEKNPIIPCEFSALDIQTSYMTTWAFDGFSLTIPEESLVCTIAEIQCAQRGWTCRVNPTATHEQLQAALDWACGNALDCRPIQPGGDHFIPDTLVDHCNWAFNAYFTIYKRSQGINACQFGGAAALQPPQNVNTVERNVTYTKTPYPSDIYPVDLVCAE